MGQLLPLFSPGGINPVKIFVHDSHSEQARGIIEAYFGGKS